MRPNKLGLPHSIPQSKKDVFTTKIYLLQTCDEPFRRDPGRRAASDSLLKRFTVLSRTFNPSI